MNPYVKEVSGENEELYCLFHDMTIVQKVV